jgi:hypothetical protein
MPRWKLPQPHRCSNIHLPPAIQLHQCSYQRLGGQVAYRRISTQFLPIHIWQVRQLTQAAVIRNTVLPNNRQGLLRMLCPTAEDLVFLLRRTTIYMAIRFLRRSISSNNCCCVYCGNHHVYVQIFHRSRRSGSCRNGKSLFRVVHQSLVDNPTESLTFSDVSSRLGIPALRKSSSSP